MTAFITIRMPPPPVVSTFQKYTDAHKTILNDVYLPIVIENVHASGH